MSKPTPLGRFVWHECLTSDPAGARTFYTGVIGWKAQAWQGDQSYTLWMNGETSVGGCMALPDEAKAGGAPPSWLSYIGTPDLDATCRDAEARGGKVLRPPAEIPTVGRFAVLADPAGAVFSAFTAAGDPPGHEGKPEDGEFSWHELSTTDPAGAVAFYGALFGWKQTSKFDMGPAGSYHLYGLGDQEMGGIYLKPPEVPAPSWLPYVRVRSADDAATAATAAGATIMIEPMEVPGGDRVAVGMDPQGAVFAVHSTKA